MQSCSSADFYTLVSTAFKQPNVLSVNGKFAIAVHFGRYICSGTSANVAAAFFSVLLFSLISNTVNSFIPLL